MFPFKDRTGRLGRVKRPGQRPHLREASVADYDQITALQIRNGLATKSFEQWMALWEDNPVYKQRNGQWPIGWVLEAESGEIVGYIGNIPLAYHFRGCELRTATPCSWVVDAPYRGFSLLLLSRVLRQEDVDLFVFTTVGPKSEPAYRGLQLSRVPIGAWHKSAFWITNYRAFAQIVLRKKSVRLAKLMSYPLSAALFFRAKFKDAGLLAHDPSVEIELCSEFDGRFDDFWEQLKHQNDNILLAVRTRETLAWHFQKALLAKSAWIVAASKGSRLIAYAIFDRLDNETIGLKRVRLVDFQAMSGSEEVLRSCLAWTLHKCREERIHVLEVMGGLDRPGWPQILAPYHRTFLSWAYYYRANDKDLGEMLKDPTVWAPSSFDGDSSL